MEKVVHKYKLGEEPKDYHYWLKKTPTERLEAIELFRQQYYTEDELKSGFQKVYKVVKLSQS